MERLKVVGTPYRNCFGILPTSIRDKIISSSTSTSLSGSIVIKVKWSAPIEKTAFIGCRGDKTCEEGYIHIPNNLLQCINLSENILVNITFISSTTSYSTTQLYNTISLKPSSYEDWEIIQYNSEYVRDNLLQQIDILNDRDTFPIYIGDIKVHLQANMKFRWGFVKLGRDTTIDIMPLKRSFKKTVTAGISESDNENMNSTALEESENNIENNNESDSAAQGKCHIFRIGSFEKYVNDILPIPPNVCMISPNNNDFCDGNDVIVTFRNNGNDNQYSQILMRLITCDYIENNEILLVSKYDMLCYALLIGDYCVIECMKLSENCKRVSLVSPLNDSEFIHINAQQICLSIENNASEDMFTEFNELYLDNAFKLKLIQFMKDCKAVKYLCNNAIVSFKDLYFNITLTTKSTQLETQLNNTDKLSVICAKHITDKYLNIMNETKHFPIINSERLPPLNKDLIDTICDNILSLNTHLIIYGSDKSIRLQYMAQIIDSIRLKEVSQISFLSFQCNSYLNAKISEIYKLFDHFIAKSLEMSPTVIVFYDLDKLIPFQSNDTTMSIVSMRSFQIGHKLLKCIENINKHNSNIFVIACITDPSCLDINFLSLDIFHSIFCLNNDESQNSKNKKPNSTKDSSQSNNNLKYLYANLCLDKTVSFDTLKTLILNHGNKWFKYASYNDLKLFIDQCMIDYAAHPQDKEMLDIICHKCETYIPASMRGLSLSKKEETETWDDIGGLTDTKKELLDIFLIPTKYHTIFSKIALLNSRTGVLLYGPSGCGKTMIGKCIADKCGLNIITVKGPELLSKYIGASESAVRDVFIRAQQNSPCIIFFDEFESIVPLRGKESTGVTDRIVNQMLTFLDGVEKHSNVFVLAASSRPDLIDSALLRPGRLDKKLLCPIPTRNDRRDILRRIVTNKDIKFNLELESECLNIDEIIEFVTKQSEYFTGADLNMIFTIAQTNAFHRCKERLIGDIDNESEMKMANVNENEQKHFDVSISFDDLNRAIKETQINVTASLRQQKQQGLTGTFNNEVDVHTVGLKSMQY